MLNLTKKAQAVTLLALIVIMVAVSSTVGATQATAASPNSAPQASQGSMLFSDDFDSSNLDHSKWTTCYWWDNNGCTNLGNNELEWYQPDDVLLNNGILQLRAQQRTVHASIPNVGEATYNYTSGMVSTGRDYYETTAPIRFDYLYGYAEMRAKIPGGQGLWPAFWLIASDHSWPPEIDVMEILGDDPTTAHMTVHYLDGGGNHGSYGEKVGGIDFSAGWHTFGVDWQPDSLTWYVDGVARARTTDPNHIPTSHMYLVANLAVGGDWPGAPGASTQFPSCTKLTTSRCGTRPQPRPRRSRLPRQRPRSTCRTPSCR